MLHYSKIEIFFWFNDIKMYLKYPILFPITLHLPPTQLSCPLKLTLLISLFVDLTSITVFFFFSKSNSHNTTAHWHDSSYSITLFSLCSSFVALSLHMSFLLAYSLSFHYILYYPLLFYFDYSFDSHLHLFLLFFYCNFGYLRF